MRVERPHTGHPRLWDDVVWLFAWACLATGVLVAGVLAPIYDDTWHGTLAGAGLCALGVVLLVIGRRRL
jgi:hypothetical protein